MEEFTTVARVLKTQGRRGEVAAEILTDFPDRFETRRRLSALDRAGGRRELEVEEFWPHKGRMVFKFRGVESISEAEALVGCELQIPRSERAELEPGAYYVGDLVGCSVFAAGDELGTLEDVVFGTGEAPTLVVKQGSRELLIPFVESFIEALDLKGKQLHMRLPEGLLELNAPLTEEEKRRQREGSEGPR